jgi:hypothetical protein
MSGRVKIVELPIFRKQWLYHAWVDPLPGLGSASQVINWREGNGLEEKLQLLGKRISTSVRLGTAQGICHLLSGGLLGTLVSLPLQGKLNMYGMYVIAVTSSVMSAENIMSLAKSCPYRAALAKGTTAVH